MTHTTNTYTSTTININTIFLHLLRLELGTEVDTNSVAFDGDWNDVLLLASHHNVLPMIYKHVKDYVQDDELLNTWKMQSIQQVLQQEQRTTLFLDIYEKLKPINPIVVKGIIIRNIYPEGEERLSGDEDLLVSREMYDECKKILLENDYVIIDEIGDEDTAFKHKDSDFVLEIHRNPFRLHSTYAFMNDAFIGYADRCIVENIQGHALQTFDYTDHLLYLVAHSCQHFIGEGAGIRQIADCGVFAGKYEDVIDWDRLKDSLKKINLYDYYVALGNICVQYLGFKHSTMHVQSTDNEIYEVLLHDVLEGGIFAQHDASRKYGGNITRRAVEASNERSSVYLWRSLFPSVDEVKDKYPFVINRPYLLPYAWILRYIKYIKKNNHQSFGKPLEIGKKRLELIQKLHIHNNHQD